LHTLQAEHLLCSSDEFEVYGAAPAAANDDASEALDAVDVVDGGSAE
jgi:uncharacterized protein YjaG (DUF416 family)